jgi:hypothetical protein
MIAGLSPSTHRFAQTFVSATPSEEPLGECIGDDALAEEVCFALKDPF